MVQKKGWTDKEFRRQYLRKWRKEHPDNVRRHNQTDLYRKQDKYANDEEYRNSLLGKRKNRWDDPEFRKKRALYMRNWRKKRKSNLSEKQSEDNLTVCNFSEKKSEENLIKRNFAEKSVN